MLNQMSGVSNMNLPLRPNLPTQVSCLLSSTEGILFPQYCNTWPACWCLWTCREISTLRWWPSVSASTSVTTCVSVSSMRTSSAPWWCALRASASPPTCLQGAAHRLRCPWAAPTHDCHRATCSSSSTRPPATVPACPLLHLLIPGPPAPSLPPSPPAISWQARAWWEI